MKSKSPVFLILLAMCVALLAFINNHPYEELALDSPVPAAGIKMKDVSGKMISLEEVKKEKGLLVIFSCNTCPYVRLNEGRIKKYSDLCIENKIGCILVNSNEAQRAEDDSFSEMVKYHKEQQLVCYYTVDERSELANAFGVGRTPQCFLFNSEGKLVYKGAIDDNVKNANAVKNPYLGNAITAVLNNEKPAVQETKSIGCTIKRPG